MYVCCEMYVVAKEYAKRVKRKKKQEKHRNDANSHKRLAKNP